MGCCVSRRRIGGVRAGSAASVWQLAPAGARLLREDGVTYRTHEPSAASCSTAWPSPMSTCCSATLVGTRRRRVPSTCQTEPACWRRYAGTGANRAGCSPTWQRSSRTTDYEDRWFIEVDLGTESLPTLLRKCGHYEAYRRPGHRAGRHGVFPLVLWLFTDAERAERLSRPSARSHPADAASCTATPPPRPHQCHPEPGL